MMTSPEFFFFLTCLFLGKMAQMNNSILATMVHQTSGLISANIGENLTLRCFYDSDAANLLWYKQILGHKPQLVSKTRTFEKNGSFLNEFKHNPRFTLETGVGMNHLKISDLRYSDLATYYCAASYSFKFEFAEGITVSVGGSGFHIHQSGPESIQPGGSVTLNCTVHTGTCEGGHSVYWFKDSGEAHPGLIYTDGGRNDLCERKPDTQTHTCIYNLPIENMNLSHAGTYYCAVASCGHIEFGNGTKVFVKDEENYPYSLMNFLNGALAITIILNISLAFSVCMLTKRKCYSCHCTESQAKFSAPSTTTAESYEDSDNLHFAALSDDASSRQCVYSTVRQ